MKIALLFPGQASQYVGMGKDLAEHFPEVTGIFDEINHALEQDFTKLLWTGPEADLNLTANTQPGVLAVSAAAWRILSKAVPHLHPSCLAGHSLGEYSAYVAAGTLSLSDAVRTVRSRGQFMQEVVPVGEGAMAALMGIEADAVAAACSEASQGEVVVPANDNAPGQVVIAGHAGAVQRAMDVAKSRGCKKSVLLPVSAPFHSPLMAPARDKLEPVLKSLHFENPRWPVIANVDALPTGTAEDARRKLIAQVDSPVRWRETLLYFQGLGVDTLIEVGPGTVLCGLAKRVSREWRLLNVEDTASLEKTLSALEQ
jgi:[acyl-carrier-protein] S-malonyltransferase